MGSLDDERRPNSGVSNLVCIIVGILSSVWREHADYYESQHASICSSLTRSGANDTLTLTLLVHLMSLLRPCVRATGHIKKMIFLHERRAAITVLTLQAALIFKNDDPNNISLILLWTEGSHCTSNKGRRSLWRQMASQDWVSWWQRTNHLFTSFSWSCITCHGQWTEHPTEKHHCPL